MSRCTARTSLDGAGSRRISAVGLTVTVVLTLGVGCSDGRPSDAVRDACDGVQLAADAWTSAERRERELATATSAKQAADQAQRGAMAANQAYSMWVIRGQRLGEPEPPNNRDEIERATRAANDARDAHLNAEAALRQAVEIARGRSATAIETIARAEDELLKDAAFELQEAWTPGGGGRVRAALTPLADRCGELGAPVTDRR